jgi:hypothetical protein
MSVNNYKVGALLTPVKSAVIRQLKDANTVILTEIHKDLTVRKLKTFYKNQNGGKEWDAWDGKADWIFLCGDYARDRHSHKSSAMPIVSTKSEDKPNPIYQVCVLHSLHDGGSSKHTIVYHNTVGLERAIGKCGLLPMGSNKAEVVEHNEQLLWLIRSSLNLLPLYTKLVGEKLNLPVGFRCEMDHKQFPFPFTYVVAQTYQETIGSIQDSDVYLNQKNNKLLNDLQLIRSRLREMDKEVGNDRGFEAVVPPAYRLEAWQHDCKEWVMENLLFEEERLDLMNGYKCPTNNAFFLWQKFFDGSTMEEHRNNLWPIFIEVAKVMAANEDVMRGLVLRTGLDTAERRINWKDPMNSDLIDETIEWVHNCVDELSTKGFNSGWISGYLCCDSENYGNYRNSPQIFSRLLHRLLMSEELRAAVLTLPSPQEALSLIWDPSTEQNVKDCGSVFFYYEAADYAASRSYGSSFVRREDYHSRKRTYPTINELDWD